MMLDLNRNQWFMVGLVVLFLGIQFRMVESIVLTPEFTRILAERTGHPVAAASNTMEAMLGRETQIPAKTIRPPEWLGWSLMSIGSVLVLHSMAMKKPGG